MRESVLSEPSERPTPNPSRGGANCCCCPVALLSPPVPPDQQRATSRIETGARAHGRSQGKPRHQACASACVGVRCGCVCGSGWVCGLREWVCEWMGTGRGRGKWVRVTCWRWRWRWMALMAVPGAGTAWDCLGLPAWGWAGSHSQSGARGRLWAWASRPRQWELGMGVCVVELTGPAVLLLASAAQRYSASSALNSSSRPIILHRPGQACLGAGPAPARIVGARLCLERGPCRWRRQIPWPAGPCGRRLGRLSGS